MSVDGEWGQRARWAGGADDAWPVPASHMGLPADEVHVWTVGLEVDPRRRAALAATLDDDERARAARLRRRQDRERYVVAHGALREILGAYIGEAPGALRFRAGRHGRPELEARGRRPLRHSLARSGGVALCAVRAAASVGVDVERIRTGFEWRPIVDAFFAPAEQRALAGAVDHAFFACWVRKEAVLKARGTGLLAPLDTVELPMRPGPLTAAGGWLHDCPPAPGYAGAVAGEGTAPRLVRRRWRP